MSKFQCTQCGHCCSHLQGMISPDDRKFIEEYAYGKLPIVQIVPIEKMSMPLFGFEAERFRKWAEEVKVDPMIVPARGIFDLDSNKFLVTSYYIDSERCPLLINNRCLIYDRKRGFICRMFPLNRPPSKDFKKVNQLLGECPALDLTISPKDGKGLFRQLYDVLPDELLNVLEYDHINDFINKKIIEMMKDKRLRPAMNYPYDKLLKRIANSESADFLEFALGKENAKNLIDEMDNNIYARKQIRQFC